MSAVRLSLLVILVAMMPVEAGVLWVQPPLVGLVSHVDQEFPDYPTYSTYQVNDVTVVAGGWVIDSISSYFTVTGDTWPGSLVVRINIFAKTGSLPGTLDDPALGTTYSASVTLGDGYRLITASGLGIHLGRGDYWIGMTPIVPIGEFGQEYHNRAALVGDMAALRNPGNGFSYGDGWMAFQQWFGETYDSPFLIEGTLGGEEAIPEPATWTMLVSGVGAVAYLRRRRQAPRPGRFTA